jgi:integration host factor subunit beta
MVDSSFPYAAGKASNVRESANSGVNMSKSELIRLVAAKNSHMTQIAVNEVVESLFETILEQAKLGNKVGLSGFGQFNMKKRDAWVGRNPKTGAAINIAASEVLKFHASPSTKVVAPTPAPTAKKKK